MEAVSGVQHLTVLNVEFASFITEFTEKHDIEYFLQTLTLAGTSKNRPVGTRAEKWNAFLDQSKEKTLKDCLRK